MARRDPFTRESITSKRVELSSGKTGEFEIVTTVEVTYRRRRNQGFTNGLVVADLHELEEIAHRAAGDHFQRVREQECGTCGGSGAERRRDDPLTYRVCRTCHGVGRVSGLSDTS